MNHNNNKNDEKYKKKYFKYKSKYLNYKKFILYKIYYNII